MIDGFEPNAWPRSWTPGWQRLYDVLHWHYGQERTAKIVHGLDRVTNDDIAAWRRVAGRPYGWRA